MYNPSWLSQFSTPQITGVVMIVMWILYLGGIRFRKYLLSKYPNREDQGLGAVEGSLLGLLALMLGFTFSMSSSRYDKRLNIVIEEANDIGTSILRADLYPDSIRSLFRTEMNRYVDHRIAFFQAGRDMDKVLVSLDSATKTQGRIWDIATTAAKTGLYNTATMQMVPSLNQTFDIVTTRNAALVAKVPDLILILLFLLCFTSSFVMGYSSGKRNDWVVSVSFSIMISLTIYMILDLDRPRSGLITNNQFNLSISALKSCFN